MFQVVQAILFLLSYFKCSSVSWDNRAIVLNGERRLLMVGSIHYPRSDPQMWPRLLRMAKDAGLNAIDTFVFWNLHEPERGHSDFDNEKDLRKFISLAHEENLYVILRVGPYVGGNWNNGGLPFWLRELSNIDFRNSNLIYQQESERWLRTLLSYVNDLKFTNGGPIILFQIEHEYGIVQPYYGFSGQLYIEWISHLAKNLSADIPWFLSEQNNIPSLLNTCDGFYCETWLSITRPYMDQPGMFTENWSGWYQEWGNLKPYRPVQDLSFSILNFIAKGGTYVAYYMFYGGTNFGRNTDNSLVTTSYDFDAPIDEFGFRNEPKYSHLQQMHDILFKHESIIIEYQCTSKLKKNDVELVVLGDFDLEESLLFLINEVSFEDKTIEYLGFMYNIPRSSITVVQGPRIQPRILFNTAKVNHDPVNLSLRSVFDEKSKLKVWYFQEPIGAFGKFSQVYHTTPLDVFSLTRDKTDYFWYSTMIVNEYNLKFAQLKLVGNFDYLKVFWNDKLLFFGLPSDTLVLEGIDMMPNNTLTILSQTFGLPSTGPHHQNYMVRLESVYLDDHDLTRNGWNHRVGLFGEDLQNLKYKITYCLDCLAESRLTWIRLKLPALNVNELKEDLSYAVDLSSMGKGMAFINGKSLGRYWSIKTNSSKPIECSYEGIYNPQKCLKGMEYSQRLYHVPKSWLNLKGENELKFFEETGGRILGIKLYEISNYETELLFEK